MKTPSSIPAASPRRRAAAGFTLIELLTVIAIIGILAAIIIPTVGKVRESARATRCKSNLREIGSAMFLHANENKNRFPVQLANQVADPLLEGTTADSWIRAVSKQISVREQGQANTVLYCPSVVQEQSATLPFSYAMNKFLAGVPMSRPANPTQMVLVRHTGQSRSAFLVEGDDGSLGLNYSDGAKRYNYLFADGHVALHTPVLAYNEHWRLQ